MTTLSMTGCIKKILPQEGFGFIETEAGDVFFHKSQCLSFNSVCKGDFVRFEVKETAKGKAATNIAMSDSVRIKQLADTFIFTKDNAPKFGEVIQRKRIQTNWYSDPNKARESLKALAKKAGCNAVLNIECKKTSIAKGYNYYGTIHSYFADLCMVVTNVPVDSNKAKSLQHAANVEIENIIGMLAAVVEEREQASRPIKRSSMSLPMLIAFGVAVVCLLSMAG